MSGLSTKVRISFGIALVAGRMRVPRPATGNTALRMGLRIVLLDRRGCRDAIAAARRQRPVGGIVSKDQTARRPNPSSPAVEQHIAGPVDLGREIIGAAMVGVH